MPQRIYMFEEHMGGSYLKIDYHCIKELSKNFGAFVHFVPIS